MIGPGCRGEAVRMGAGLQAGIGKPLTCSWIKSWSTSRTRSLWGSVVLVAMWCSLISESTSMLTSA